MLDSGLQPVEYRSTFDRPSVNHSLSLRINYAPSKKHKLYASLNSAQGNRAGQSVGLFTLPERAARSTQQAHSLALTHNYIGSPQFFSRTTLIARYNRTGNYAGNDRPAVNVADAFSAGGANVNGTSRSLNFELSNDTTRQIGKVSVEYGFFARAIGTYQNSRTNFNGTYSFNGRVAPLLDENNEPLVDEAGSVVTGQITSLESYRRTFLLRRLGYSAARIRELGGGADQFSISGGKTAIGASQIEYGLYAQGSYNLRKNLGVSFGVRYENQNNISSPFDFAPRASLIWSPKRKAKEHSWQSLPRVSAGIGFSYSRFGIGNLIGIRQTNDDGRAFYLISAASANGAVPGAVALDSFPNAPSLELLAQLSLPRIRRFYAPDIRPPSELTSNVTLNKKLPMKFSLNTSVSYSRGFRRQLTRNINAPLAGTFDPRDPQTAIYPFGNQGNIYRIGSGGKSESWRLAINVIVPPIRIGKKTGSLTLRYATERKRDDLVTGSGSPFDAFDFTGEFGSSANDGVQFLNGSFSQQLPFNFSLAGTWTLRTGTRFNITTGRDSNGDGFYGERPAFAADPNKPGVVRTRYGVLDPDPAPGAAIIPRNFGRGSGATDFDLSLMKIISFGTAEKNTKQSQRSLVLSVFVSNVFNIVNPGNPVGNMSSPRFVRVLAGAGGDFSGNPSDVDFISNGNPRSLSFNATFNF